METHTDANNRRSFYRLQDRVFIEFFPITQQQADELLASRKALSPKNDEDSMYLDSLNRQMGSLMPLIRTENANLAQFLDIMNKKVDFLAGVMFFERYRNVRSDTKAVRTNTVDISEGGLSFNSKVAYKTGTCFKMKLIIVSARVGIEAVATVVSSTPKQRKDLNYFRIGVQFPQLPEEDRRSLTRYIMERQREQVRSLSDIDDWEEA